MRSIGLLAFLTGLLVGCGDGTVVCLDEAELPATEAWVTAALADGDTLAVHTVEGERLRVPLGPERIVSLLPGLTDTIVMLGGASSLVGVTEHAPPIPELDHARRLAVLPIAWEMLQTLAPDLIVVDATLGGAGLETLRRRFPAVLPLRSGSLVDLRVSVEVLAEVLGTDAARRRARRFTADLASARKVAEPADFEAPPLKVLLLAQPDPVYVLGPGALLDDMLRACGCVNIACDLGRASGPFAAELAITRRPDWILVTGGSVEDVPVAAWSSVPAVEAGRVVRADADDLVRAGPGTPAALKRLAAVLHGRRPPGALVGER